MDASEVTEVCRLCPSSGGGEDLLYVFDERLSVKNNMKEVILVTTGIEIQENDLISKKICHRCCTKTLQMFLFRQDALTQDRALKEKCSRFLEDKGIRLPNTCVTIKRERRDSFLPVKRPKLEPHDVPSTAAKVKQKKILHPSVTDIYENFPQILLPKKCLARHLAPVVSCTMGEVERYFKKRKLDLRKFIFKPGTKKPPSNAVAKKRTSFPTKQKTVSPIKISKVFEQRTVQTARPSIDYVCTSVQKAKPRRKSVPSSDVGRSPMKVSPESKAAASQTPSKLVGTHKLSIEQLAETQTSLVEPLIPVSQTEKVRTTAPVEQPISEDSRQSYSSSTSKPEFIESLGLTPTVTATKSQTLHVCNLCGSVHNNAFKLKTHTRKHMVCQFCKLRFKSVETKQDHVDNSCLVKKILNSPGPFVQLEKVHFNLAVRNKYKKVFSDFETVPGLVEPDLVEQVTVKATSPLPYLNTDDVVLISDDEGVPTKSGHPTLQIPTTTSSNVVSSEAENAIHDSVSIVRPDVRIQNDTVLDRITTNVTDKQAIKDLIVLFKPQRIRTVEKTLQTDVPANKDIKINTAEGYCEFKNLKEQLLSYRIPVSIIDGPFHVAYQYKNNSNAAKTMALWDDLPVIDVYKKTAPVGGNSSVTPLQRNFSIDRGTGGNCPVQSPHMISGPSSVQNNSFTVTTPIGNAKYTINANTSNSSTPLLQNFAQSTTPTPAVNKTIPIPRKYVKSVRYYNTSSSNGNVSSPVAKKASSRPVSSNRKSLPAKLSTVEKTKSTLHKSRSSVHSVVSSSSVSTTITNTVGVQPANSTASLSRTDSASSSASEISRFRVKNVWELQ